MKKLKSSSKTKSTEKNDDSIDEFNFDKLIDRSFNVIDVALKICDKNEKCSIFFEKKTSNNDDNCQIDAKSYFDKNNLSLLRRLFFKIKIVLNVQKLDDKYIQFRVETISENTKNSNDRIN